MNLTGPPAAGGTPALPRTPTHIHAVSSRSCLLSTSEFEGFSGMPSGMLIPPGDRQGMAGSLWPFGMTQQLTLPEVASSSVEWGRL